MRQTIRSIVSALWSIVKRYGCCLFGYENMFVAGLFHGKAERATGVIK